MLTTSHVKFVDITHTGLLLPSLPAWQSCEPLVVGWSVLMLSFLGKLILPHYIL